MKKTLLLILTLILGVCLLCACFGSGNGSDDPAVGDGFYGEGKEFYLVEGEGVTLGSSADKISKYIHKETKIFPKIIPKNYSGSEHEIVFGSCEREVSKRAYRQLEGYYTGKSNESIWLVYVKDGSACIAFDTKFAMMKGLDYFINYCLTADFGKENGVVAYGTFNYLEMVKEERLNNQTKSFNALESKIGTDGVEALKLLYAQYDESLYMWMANLWCPDVGGFYYSNSGRDTEGFLPDIESTAQVLSFLSNSGMLAGYKERNGAGKWASALLDDYPEIANKILSFAINLQAEDGFFYHPQWKDAPIASRLGRDLGNAKSIIKGLGGAAHYPYPDEVKEESDTEVLSTAVSLTGRLSGSSVTAVSKVIATATPAYLTSLDKWAAYIDSLGIDRGNSYSGGNTLVAQKSLIKAAGQEYCDYLINYLNEKQCENGTWEKEISYGALDGLMKISGIYESFGVTLPRAYAAAESCVARTIDLSPKTSSRLHVTDIYNTWYALAAILRMSKAEFSTQNDIRRLIKDNFAEMVNSTYEKIHKYQKADGSYSYYENETSYTSQGSVVAVAGTNEGDVNATCISTATLLKWMFNCIDESMVPMYYPADFVLFMDTVYALDSVVKNEAPDPVAITFDDFVNSNEKMDGGIVTKPAEIIDVAVRDKELLGASYKWVEALVVDSPAPQSKDDKAIKFSVITYPCTCNSSPCTCKKLATSASLIYSKTQNGSILGDAYIAEFDYYLDSWAKNDIISQLSFAESTSGGTSMSFNLSTYVGTDGKNYIRIGDNGVGLDGMKNSSIVDGIPVKEWARFRFELYKTEQLIPDENSGEIKQYKANVCKIYVNGEYVGESDAAQVKADGTTDTKHVNAFSISGYRHQSSTIYVDNVKVYRTNTEYICEEEPGNSVLDNLAVDKTKTVATFNDGKTATYYLKNLAVPGYVNYSVKEIAGKTALYVNKYAVPTATQTYTQAKLSNPEDEGECYTYETKIYYDSANMKSDEYVTQFSINASSSLSFIGFNLKFYGTHVEMQHNKNFLNGSSSEYSGKLKGIDGGDVDLPVDRWFTFRLEFYRAEDSKESAVKIFTGDENGENMTLRAEFRATQTDRTDAIERFLFTHMRAASKVSVYLDDISFTRSNKPFLSDLPDEHVDDFKDGYVSGGVRISDNTASADYAGDDKVSAGKDPKNSGNNVIKVVSKSTSSTPYSIKIDHSGSQITNGISTFKSKIYLESISQGHFATLAFSRADGTLQELNLCGGGGKNYAQLVIPDGYTVTSNDINESNAKNRLDVGKWYTVTVVFTNADDADDVFCEVFIDGSSIGKLVGYKSTSNVQFTELYGTSLSSVIYLDDVSFREALIAKTPTGGDGADERTTLTEGESFDKLSGVLVGDGTDSNVKFGKNDGYSLTKTQPDDTIIVTSDPTGASGSVLMFRDGATSSHSTVWVAASGTKYSPNIDKYVISTFETKLFIEKPMAGSADHIAQLYFTTGQSSRTSMNLIASKKNGEFAYAYFSILGSGNSKGKLEFNEWYTVRIDYHNAAEGSTLTPYMEIFINGESAGISEKVNNNDSVNYYDVNGFFWKSYSSGRVTYYFDNMSMTEKQADYPTSPVTPNPPAGGNDTPEKKCETFENLTTLKGDGTDSDVIFGIGNVENSTRGTVVEGDEIKIVKDPTGADNNVLMFKDGSTSSGSTIFVNGKSANGLVTNGLSVFETRLYVPKSEILSSGNSVIAQPQYNHSGRSSLHSENLTVASDKSSIYFTLDNTSGSETSKHITTDAWHTLRLEFYNYSTVEENPIIKVYIDGLYAGYMTTTKVTNASGFMWRGLSSARYTIYFDDISYTETAMPTK